MILFGTNVCMYLININQLTFGSEHIAHSTTSRMYSKTTGACGINI